MATEVYKKEEILLQDGKEVLLRPLAIGRLRRFYAAWENFPKAETDDEGMNVFINCAGISLEENFKGDFDSLKASKAEQENGEFLSEEYKEYLENVLDLETIYKVLEVCGGIKLNDPKLVEAAQAMLQGQEQE